MTDDELRREQQRLQEIQRQREQLAREMEKEVERVRAYILLGDSGRQRPTDRK